MRGYYRDRSSPWPRDKQYILQGALYLYIPIWMHRVFHSHTHSSGYTVYTHLLRICHAYSNTYQPAYDFSWVLCKSLLSTLALPSVAYRSVNRLSEAVQRFYPAGLAGFYPAGPGSARLGRPTDRWGLAAGDRAISAGQLTDPPALRARSEGAPTARSTPWDPHSPPTHNTQRDHMWISYYHTRLSPTSRVSSHLTYLRLLCHWHTPSQTVLQGTA